MKIKQAINVRGSLRKMKIGDAPLELPKSEHPIHSVRTAAWALNITGKRFVVNDTGLKIIVTRIS